MNLTPKSATEVRAVRGWMTVRQLELLWVSSKSTKRISSSRPSEPGVEGGEEFDASQGLCGREGRFGARESPGKTSWLKSDAVDDP